MDQHIKAALAIPLLASLGEQRLQQGLAEGGMGWRRFAKGQLIHGEGEPCQHLEVVIMGQVAVERIGEDGSLMTIAAFGAGDCVGGNLLFSSHPVYHLAVTAVAPTTVLAIGKDTLFSLFQQSSAFLASYLGYVADNASLLEDKLKRYANLPARQRVLNYLHLQRQCQGSPRIALPTTKKALAAQLGIQRTSLSRVLQQMEQQGLIRFDRHSITLLETSQEG